MTTGGVVGYRDEEMFALSAMIGCGGTQTSKDVDKGGRNGDWNEKFHQYIYVF
jgi:hypothetical protein